MSDDVPPLSMAGAESLRDAWRAIRDVIQGRKTPIGDDCEHRTRVAIALAVVAAGMLRDNLALGNHLEQDDPAVLTEAVKFAEARVTDAELAMLDEGRVPPQAPVPGEPSPSE